jgi:uncharacterized membrane protein YadS
MMQSDNPAPDNAPLRPPQRDAVDRVGNGSSPFGQVESAQGITEDLWAIILGVIVLLSALIAAVIGGDALTGVLAQPGSWDNWPLDSLVGKGRARAWLGLGSTEGPPPWLGSLVAITIIGTLGFAALANRRGVEKSGGPLQIATGFLLIAALASAAFVMAGQKVLKAYGLEYVLWALLLGLIISNTVGLPRWLRGAVRGELFIKWGLVLLGAEVLLGKLVALGIPGIMVSWVVTPIVLVVTFWFGCRVLRIGSPSLVMVVAADMSVCGVSAAIATAAACRAKREELSLAIGMSLAFTAVMMVAMPMALRLAGVDAIVGGAWIGGTIDSTGAVAAAGAALADEVQGDRAMKVAVTVKMIQNVLIGVIAFAVSVYWAARYETADERSHPSRNGGFFSEVWRRFPKFVLGFLAASLVASTIAWSGSAGEAIVETAVDNITKYLRNWLFCLAFVCIGLETHFRTLLPALSGGKTLVLYVAGQSFNILLTGIMVWLVFGWLFRDAITQWLP